MWIETLATHHQRARFDCGNSSLNLYLQRYARQNRDSDVGLTYVAVENEGDERILAFYTLAGSALKAEQLPDEKTPPYPVGTALIARLAVDLEFQNRGLGKLLLDDIFRRVLLIGGQMALFAIEVDAIDDLARRFYLKHGFKSCGDNPNHLYIALKTVRKLGLTS